MVNIIDKAQWHIDNGIDSKKVISHFNDIFIWLDSKAYLTDDGQEILDVGIDASVSINSRMVNNIGMDFLSKYYDKYLSDGNFNINNLEEYYKVYMSTL